MEDIQLKAYNLGLEGLTSKEIAKILSTDSFKLTKKMIKTLIDAEDIKAKYTLDSSDIYKWIERIETIPEDTWVLLISLSRHTGLKYAISTGKLDTGYTPSRLIDTSGDNYIDTFENPIGWVKLDIE